MLPVLSQVSLKRAWRRFAAGYQAAVSQTANEGPDENRQYYLSSQDDGADLVVSSVVCPGFAASEHCDCAGDCGGSLCDCVEGASCCKAADEAAAGATGQGEMTADGFVLCPRQPVDSYCDGEGDCATSMCSCALAQELCRRA